MKRRVLRWCAAGLVALAVCLPRNVAQSDQAVSVMTLPLSAQGATVDLSGPDGLHAAATFPANDAAPGTTITFRWSRWPLASAESLTAIDALVGALPALRTPVGWFEVTTSSTIDFDPGIVEFRLALPTAAHLERESYAAEACDELACRAVRGSLSRIGSSIVVGNRHLPIRFHFRTLGGHPYLAAVFAQAESQ